MTIPARQNMATPWVGSAADHYENFPVASWLLPASARAPIAAVYQFARYADDVADEGSAAPDVRLAELSRMQRALDCLKVGPMLPGNAGGESGSAPHPRVEPLRPFFRTHGLQTDWFSDLLSAFAQDVSVKRHPDRAHLMDYCRRSANPVGRIVLQVCAQRRAQTEPLSDAICSSLQLINFLQDFAHDWRIGRLYVPLDELAAAGLDEAAIDTDVRAGRARPALRALLADQARIARELMVSGQPLVRIVGWRLGLELRAVVAGGLRVLDKLAGSGFDPIERRPKLGKADILPALAGALR